MSFAEIFPMMARRWYAVLFAVILGAAAAVIGLVGTSASYDAHAQILLLPSAATSGGTKGPGNPYLALSNPSGDRADHRGPRHRRSTVTALQAAGFTASFTVLADTSLNAPVAKITATDKSKAMADRTMRAAVAKFQSLLTDAQTASGAPRTP